MWRRASKGDWEQEDSDLGRKPEETCVLETKWKKQCSMPKEKFRELRGQARVLQGSNWFSVNTEATQNCDRNSVEEKDNCEPGTEIFKEWGLKQGGAAGILYAPFHWIWPRSCGILWSSHFTDEAQGRLNTISKAPVCMSGKSKMWVPALPHCVLQPHMQEATCSPPAPSWSLPALTMYVSRVPFQLAVLGSSPVVILSHVA